MPRFVPLCDVRIDGLHDAGDNTGRQAEESAMSLYIDVDKVTAILLADGWHMVADNSFDLDAYEYQHDLHTLLSGGQEPTVPATGARWYEGEITQTKFFCPLTAILAVRY